MKLSTKGRYGLRAMVDLAQNSEQSHVSLNSIAERQDISVQYLEQVFSALRKAGLVRSVKGASGGYSLSKSAKQITVGAILKALEGNLSIVGALKDEAVSSKNQIERCIQETIWIQIDETIDTFIESVTLEALVENSRKYSFQDQFMFHI